MKYLQTMSRIKNIDEYLRFFCNGRRLKATSRNDIDKGMNTQILLEQPKEKNKEVE